MPGLNLGLHGWHEKAITPGKFFVTGSLSLGFDLDFTSDD